MRDVVMAVTTQGGRVGVLSYFHTYVGLGQYFLVFRKMNIFLV